jgi:ABC-type uncharacterized transport system permease subunit
VNFVSAVLYLILLTAAWWLIKRTRKGFDLHISSEPQ